MHDYSTYTTEQLQELYSAYNLSNDYASFCAAQAIKEELKKRRQEA